LISDLSKQEKEKEREGRIGLAQQKLAEEQQRKVNKQQEKQRLATENREKQLEARRQKTKNLHRREEEQRKQVEDRRKAQTGSDKVGNHTVANFTFNCS